jgi:hypothetical protein
LSWFSRKAALRRRGPGDAENEVEDEKDAEEDEARPSSTGMEANLERTMWWR